MALTLVDAYTRHLPNQPGGSDYSILSSTLSSSSTVSTLTKVYIMHTLQTYYNSNCTKAYQSSSDLNFVNDVKLAFVDFCAKECQWVR